MQRRRKKQGMSTMQKNAKVAKTATNEKLQGVLKL